MSERPLVPAQHFDKTLTGLFEPDWDNTKRGWYEVVLSHSKGFAKHLEIIYWLYEHVDNCERHCRWAWLYKSTTKVKFRYERDYIWFNLTWG